MNKEKREKKKNTRQMKTIWGREEKKIKAKGSHKGMEEDRKKGRKEGRKEGKLMMMMEEVNKMIMRRIT